MKWRCPICRKPTDSDASQEFPFCSERCRLLDLGNWASEKYKISEPVIDESMPEESERGGPGRDADEH
ncbi:MAG: DNA gyrase inhibitor YacG [Candidatus Acidiferrales bacterium]